MTYFPGATSNRDAFGRERVSSPNTLFDSKLLYDAGPLDWDDAVVSGAGTSSTYNTGQASVTLAVTANTGNRARQTFRRWPYQSGKSLMAVMTGVLGAAVANSYARCGLYDANNGLFFEVNGTGIGVVRRTSTSGSPVDTRVAQASWNLDTLSGAGGAANPSGLTLDLTKVQIFVIDLQWLGAGTVRFGFDIAGQTIWCHAIHNANILTTVYMSTPNLPVRWEVGTTASATRSVTQICTTVINEGGLQETGKLVQVTRGVNSFVALNTASYYPLVAVRLQATRIDTVALLQMISLICTTTTDFRWSLLLNPTVTGTAFSFSAITNSGLEADVATTNATTVSGGIELLSGFWKDSNSSFPNIPNSIMHFLGCSIGGTRDVMVLAVSRLTGAVETYYGGMTMQEV